MKMKTYLVIKRILDRIDDNSNIRYIELNSLLFSIQKNGYYQMGRPILPESFSTSTLVPHMTTFDLYESSKFRSIRAIDLIEGIDESLLNRNIELSKEELSIIDAVTDEFVSIGSRKFVEIVRMDDSFREALENGECRKINLWRCSE